MTYSTWQAIADIPWYVYPLYAYFLYIAYLTTKPRALALRSLITLPFVIIPLTLMNVFSVASLNRVSIIACSVGFLAGTLLGWLHFRLLNVQIIPTTARLYIPGSWLSFAAILSFLVTIYYCANQYGFNPKVLLQSKYAIEALIFYGVFSGLFIGRMFYSIRCWKVGPFYNPVPTTAPALPTK